MKNPFHEIVELFNETPRVVTIQLLDQVRSIMLKTGGVKLLKYSDVFDVLEYLNKGKALVLTTTDSGTHLITKKKYVENK